MSYSLEESLAALSADGNAQQFGAFSVKREDGFLHFSPPISYQGETVERLKIRASTFKHMGPHTLVVLFNKLIPGIAGKAYAERADENPAHPPGVVLFSTTSCDTSINFDILLGRPYSPESQFRSHINRLGHDEKGPYLDWPHLAPMDEKQYLKKRVNQSKEKSA